MAVTIAYCTFLQILKYVTPNTQVNIQINKNKGAMPCTPKQKQFIGAGFLGGFLGGGSFSFVQNKIIVIASVVDTLKQQLAAS